MGMGGLLRFQVSAQTATMWAGSGQVIRLGTDQWHDDAAVRSQPNHPVSVAPEVRRCADLVGRPEGLPLPSGPLAARADPAPSLPAPAERREPDADVCSDSALRAASTSQALTERPRIRAAASICCLSDSGSRSVVRTSGPSGTSGTARAGVSVWHSEPATLP